MSYHTDEDRLKVAEILAKDIISFRNKCKNQEHTDMQVKCEELENIAVLAGMVCADSGDYEK